MAFILEDTVRIPPNRSTVKIDSENGGFMEAGNRIQLKADFGEGIVTIVDETVPEGKVWVNIGFQFQVEEDDA